MICPSCSEKLPDDARFCGYCGTVLAQRCGVCDTEILPGGKFCHSCGTPIGEPVASPGASAQAARKVVTVMFADLSGSTALEERMDAESVRSILDRFYAAMRAEVERFSGKVVKFTGDGVMAAFGVPDVQEDDAVRAVDSALAMQEEIHQLADDLGLDVLLNIGINTGEVVVSATDDDVVGDSVNVAARLEGAATGGEILVGEETWRLTRATSRYEPVEPLTLKGKAEPVPAYRLLAVDERTADSAAAPFVGRQSELGRLLDVFHDAVDANACRLVTIIGSPGLGKTRLARELMSELSDSARVREARCDPAGSSTFAPIADALRAGGSISETDSEESVVEALADRLPDDDPDRDRVARRAAAIFGAGVPGTTEETFWALRKLLEAAAREQPVVLVLDDIHWAEPLLLDLIEHFAEWIRDAPVLLVGTARPELRDLRPSLVEGGRAAAVLALEGLDRDATAQLALNLLETDSLPSELLAKIPASTEGNPLFVRELVRMLVDDDVLRRTSDGWDVTVDVDAIQVPPTISSLLSARVDRLRNDERAVVELASVVGKEFYRGALIELAPPSVRGLVDGCLESLRRKELVEPVGTYWIDEPVYTFHHALIQDAAYRRVLKERRAELHERVAGWLETKTADVLGEHDELLGYHLEQAHDYKQQLGRPDDDLGSRAAEFLGRAAQRALESDDLPAAAALSGRALERLSRSDERRAGPLLMRCEALLSMGDVAQGAAAVSEYDAIASTPRRRAWATCFNGQLAILTASQRLQETESLVAAAAAELAELGDQAGAAKGHTVHASALAGLGRFADCEAVLDQALTAARAANDRRRITATLGSAPHAALWGPNPVSRAGGRCLDIVRLLRITTGSPAVEATSLRCQAVLEAFRGRAEAARRMLGSARRTLSELGLEHELLEAEQFAGIVELVDGDPAAAEQHLRDAFEGFTKVGVDVLAAQSAARLARALLNLDEDGEAETFLAFAEQHGGQDLQTALSWRSTKAELLARRGEHAEARRLAEEAVAIAERTDALIDHGIACRSLGVVLRAAGDADGAQGAEARALALFERKGATALVGVAQPVSPRTREPADTGHLHVTNAATELNGRIGELFEQRSWSQLDSVVGADCVFDDRRPGLRTDAVGPRGMARVLHVVAETGTARFESEPLAIRGDRLALIRCTARGRGGPGGLETEFLSVQEIDADGLLVAMINLPPDAMNDALSELDRRYVAGDGAQCAELVTAGVIYARAIMTNDWELMRTVISDDVVLVDHRLASWGEMRGVDAFADVFASGNAQAAREAWMAVFHRLNPTTAVGHARVGSVTADGVRADQSRVSLFEFGSDGRFSRIEYFDPGDLSTALRRYDELVAAASDGGPVGRELDNECVRAYHRLIDRIVARDWAAVRAMHADDVLFEDIRAGMGTAVRGIDAYMQQQAVIADLGAVPAPAEVAAVRGARFALVRLTMVIDDGVRSFVDTLQVTEIDTSGRFVAFRIFDPTDLEIAVSDLEARYRHGEGAPFADVMDQTEAWLGGWRAHDHDAHAETVTDDVVLIDHRPVSFGEIHGRDRYMSYWGSALTMAEGSRTAYVAAYHRLSPTMGVCEARISAVSSEGVEQDRSRLVLARLRDGTFDHIEYFPLERRDDAVAKFDELDDIDAGVEPRENACTRELFAGFRDLFVARDWPAIAQRVADECLFDDRRPGFSTRIVGRDGCIEQWKTVAAVGATDLTFSVLATRGERLALASGLWHSTETVGWEVEALHVCEIDQDGRWEAIVTFTPESIEAAFAELDARFVAGEAADRGATSALGLLHRFVGALNGRDWSSARGMLADDLVVDDHRPASLGVVGPDEYINAQKPMWNDLVPDLHMRVEAIPWIERDRGLVVARAVGTREGAPVEISLAVLARIRRGRLAEIEFFPAESVGDVVDRLRRRAAAPAVSSLENHAVRSARRIVDAYSIRDWDSITRLTADDYEFEDRRPGLQVVIHGKQAGVDNIRAAADNGAIRLVFEPIAVRGELNVLARYRWDASERGVDVLIVDQFDADGCSLRAVLFAPDDLDAAVEELDRSYMEGDGAPFADSIVTMGAYRAANARDWARYREWANDDFVLIDHRPASIGRIDGIDAFIDWVRPMLDLVPDVVSFTRAIHAIDVDRHLVEVMNVGRTPEGAEIETRYLALQLVREGRLSQLEFFPLEAFDAAMARFHELGPQAPAATHDLAASRLANAATRFVDRLKDSMDMHDMEAFIALHADSFVHDDRRQGIRHVTSGLDRIREYAETSHDLGYGTFRTVDVLAVRGDRLCLTRRIYRDPASGADFESEQVIVDEVDENGRVVYATVFDPTDVDAAWVELDERYAAGEDASLAESIRLYSATAAAWNTADFERFRSFIDPDVVFVDHRPLGLSVRQGVDDLVEMPRTMSSITAEIHRNVVRFVAVRPHAALACIRVSGTNADGGSFENEYLQVAAHDGALIALIERFGMDQEAAAIARTDELSRERSAASGAERDALENDATRTCDAIMSAALADDWKVVAALHSEDCRLVDRRPGVGNEWTGRAAAVDQVRAVRSVGGFEFTNEVLAIRGRSLALVRSAVRFGDPSAPFDAGVIAIFEVDDEDRLRRFVAFAADDLRAAFDTLDELYMSGEGAAYADVLSVMTAATRAVSDHRLDDFFDLVADDTIYFDHRLTSLGPRAKDEWRAALGALLDVIPTDTLFRFVRYHAIDADRGWATALLTGVSPDGVRAEFPMHLLATVSNGQMTAVETFDSDAFAEAQAAYTRLGPQPDAAPLQNACTRLLDAMHVTFAERRWDVQADRIAEDVFMDDRRRGLQNTINGRDALLEAAKTIASFDPLFEADVIAIRGDSLALVRETYVTSPERPHDWRVELLSIHEIGADGRICRVTYFDADDLDGAFAELDDRYAATLPPIPALIVRLSTRSFAAVNRRDWDLFRDAFAPGFVALDHQNAGAGEIGGVDAFVEWAKLIVELSPDVREDIVAFHHIDDNGAVAEIRAHGENAEGGAIEFALVYLGLVVDGLVTRMETFPVGRLDEVLARYRELTADDPWREVRQVAFRALADRDWERFAGLFDDDLVSIDHRPPYAGRLDGARGFVEGLRRSLDPLPGVRPEPVEVVAVDEARMLITVGTAGLPDGLPDDELTHTLYRRNDGLITWMETFPADRLADARTAFASLGVDVDRRMHNRSWTTYRQATEARVRDDTAAFLALHADDCRIEDHRPGLRSVSSGPSAAHAEAESMRSVGGLLFDRYPIAVRGDRLVLIRRRFRDATDPIAFEIEALTLLEVNADGLISRVDHYETSDLDEILAEMDRRVTPAGSGDNLCATRTQALIDRIRARDWDGMRRMVSEAFHGEDRRAGLGSTYDRTAQIEMYRAMHDLGMTRFEASVIATRGERLVLLRVDVAATPDSGDEFTVEVLALNELDDEGLFVWSVLFDATDLDAAFTELEERYLAGEGEPFADLWRNVLHWRDVRDRADWDAFEQQLTEDCVYVDHRPAMKHHLEGREAIMNVARNPWAADSRQSILAVHAIDESHVLIGSVSRGTNSEAGEVEVGYLNTFCFNEGRVTRVERFDPDDLRTALARFNKLADAGPRPDVPELENHAVRIGRRFEELFSAGDWTSVGALLSENSVYEDRRRGMAYEIRGRDIRVENLRVIGEYIGANVAPSTPLAVRGDRLALHRMRFGSEDGLTETELLQVDEYDEDGFLARSITFDPNDLDAAFSELDRRYLATSDADERDRVMIEYIDAYNARDWERARSLATSDAVLVDHHPAGRGTVSADQYIEQARALVDLAPDGKLRLVAALRDGPGVVFVTSASGSDKYGNAVGWDHAHVIRLEGGRMALVERFPLVRLDDARRRAAELSDI